MADRYEALRELILRETNALIERGEPAQDVADALLHNAGALLIVAIGPVAAVARIEGFAALLPKAN